MTILLHGGQKNVGDFLIADRAQAIVEANGHGPVKRVARQEPLGPHLDDPAAAGGIVLAGGPGYQVHFYPKIYDLNHPHIERIEVPVFCMGLGWHGFPVGGHETFRFDAPSRRAMAWISAQSTAVGCRDDLTVQALQRNGIENAKLLGCPAWYDLARIGTPARSPDPNEVETLVFSTPQDPRFVRQAAQAMKIVAKHHPDAKRIATWHRGWAYQGGAQGTKLRWSLKQRWLKRQAEKQGYETRDVAYDTGLIDFYEACDLHIGYRVHAQIRFLSARLPSILIHEDGRGFGHSGTFDLPDIDGHAKDALERLDARLEAERDQGYARFRDVFAKIDATYPEMQKALKGTLGR